MISIQHPNHEQRSAWLSGVRFSTLAQCNPRGDSTPLDSAPSCSVSFWISAVPDNAELCPALSLTAFSLTQQCNCYWWRLPVGHYPSYAACIWTICLISPVLHPLSCPASFVLSCILHPSLHPSCPTSMQICIRHALLLRRSVREGELKISWHYKVHTVFNFISAAVWREKDSFCTRLHFSNNCPPYIFPPIVKMFKL